MEDPLGAAVPIIDWKTIVAWNNTDVPEYDIIVDDPDNMRRSPFPWRDDLNNKIRIWSGDLTQLNTEAIVNSTNEAMTERSPLTERIFQRAGSQLRQEVKANIKMCRTGDAKITKGYRLPARYVIHTVGPRYNIKYKTAAESALFNSYRSVLQLVRENNISTLGLPSIHSMRRAYPSYEGAHIGIRAIRRFLEKYGRSVETIVFVVVGDDEDVYLNLMPLYFPRNKSEEDFSAYHLPYDVGNEDGEPVIAERQIRIMSKPTVHKQDSTEAVGLDESVNINEAFETSVAVGAHSFAKMEGDIDKIRRQRISSHAKPNMSIEHVQSQKRYERWLRKARQEDLTEISSLRCFYQSGFDKYDRAVVVFIAKSFPAVKINLEKAALHFIHVMEPVVSQPYVVVYVHTETTKENVPDPGFVRDIHSLVDSRYKNNLKAFYILHPTFWSKVKTWIYTTFNLSDVKNKIHNIPGLEFLYSRIPPDQLDLPDFVLDYDIRVNGTRYYTPEEDEAIGAL